MNTAKILSRHAKLSAAVKAAKIDLSYNEPLAQADLTRADNDRHHGEAFVVEVDGKVKVWSVFTSDLPLLNEYSPFSGCLHDGAFRIARDCGDRFEINPVGLNRDARKAIASFIGHLGEGYYATTL